MPSTQDFKALVREAVLPCLKHVDYVCMVGSVARGTHHEGSDVDIVAIAKKPYKLSDFVKIHDACKQKLSRNVDLIVYQRTNRLQEQDDFVDNAISDAVDVFQSKRDDLKLCVVLYKIS